MFLKTVLSVHRLRYPFRAPAMVRGGHRQLEHLQQSWLGGTGSRAGAGNRELHMKHLGTHRSGKQARHGQGAGRAGAEQVGKPD